jgi:hypothetical protein
MFQLHTVADEKNDVFGSSPLFRGISVKNPWDEKSGHQEENGHGFCDTFFLHNSLLT